MKGTEAMRLEVIHVDPKGPKLIAHPLPMQGPIKQLFFQQIQQRLMVAPQLIRTTISQVIYGEKFQAHHHLLLRMLMQYKHK